MQQQYHKMHCDNRVMKTGQNISNTLSADRQVYYWNLPVRTGNPKLFVHDLAFKYSSAYIPYFHIWGQIWNTNVILVLHITGDTVQNISTCSTVNFTCPLEHTLRYVLHCFHSIFMFWLVQCIWMCANHHIRRGKSIISYRHPQLTLVHKPASKQELTQTYQLAIIWRNLIVYKMRGDLWKMKWVQFYSMPFICYSIFFYFMPW